MPAGISVSDFYYILPEIVLTVGALLLLVADILLPRMQYRRVVVSALSKMAWSHGRGAQL